MPANLLKVYSALLELSHLTENDRKSSLKRVFRRDFEESDRDFLGKPIRPTKNINGDIDLDNLFHHLITVGSTIEDVQGNVGRIFDLYRSERLHWVKFHLENSHLEEIQVFSTEERDEKKRRNVNRTYLYNKTEKYVVVLEPQRSGLDYYLLSAYYLNKEYSIKQMNKKIKRKLSQIL
ncbi:hypothetical protein RYH73_03470 [Olivibacter sp. CPCC 100613]|uniref:hypothetical protein n=1 Tax=Olivibacter sp. CPCC 100613 TaxID=3079931 RepID=UPI002FF7FDA2